MMSLSLTFCSLLLASRHCPYRFLHHHAHSPFTTLISIDKLIDDDEDLTNTIGAAKNSSDFVGKIISIKDCERAEMLDRRKPMSINQQALVVPDEEYIDPRLVVDFLSNADSWV